MKAGLRVQPGAVWYALRAVPPILWRADARLSSALLLFQTVQILVPLAQLWIAKLIIDRLVDALRLPHPLDASNGILWLVATGFGLAAVGLVCRESANYARQVLAERLTGYVSTTILAHAQQLDLEMLERRVGKE